MKVILLILVIIIIYIYGYFIYPSDISILQSSLSNFNFNLLLKRQPLVIDDKVKNIIGVIDAWFSYNIIQDHIFNEKRIWNINEYKYLVIYCTNDDDILLYQAGNKVIDDTPDNREPVINIILKQNQFVVIPYRWYYNIKNINSFKLYGIHDYITYILDKII